MANILDERQEFEAKVIAKAWADSSFKAALLSGDANQTLVDFAVAEGYDVSKYDLSEMTINVVEETPTELTLVIPPDPANMELTEEAMDVVSGGISLASCHM